MTSWTIAHQASLPFTISQSLLKLMSTESMIPSNHLVHCHPLLLPPSIDPESGSFPVNWLFASSGQSTGNSTSTSAFPMNIQDWFPLELTGLISLQSKGLQESPPTPQFESINFSVLSLLYGPTIKYIHEYWKDHSFDYNHRNR